MNRFCHALVSFSRACSADSCGSRLICARVAVRAQIEGADVSVKALADAERMQGKGAKAKRRWRAKRGDAAGDAEADVFVVNTEDSRFAAVYAEPGFAIDPTAPEFRATKGMGAILEARRRKRAAREGLDAAEDAGTARRQRRRAADGDVAGSGERITTEESGGGASLTALGASVQSKMKTKTMVRLSSVSRRPRRARICCVAGGRRTPVTAVNVTV